MVIKTFGATGESHCFVKIAKTKEGGCVVRKAARLNVPKWSHLNPGDREGIYSTVTDDFRFPEHITSKTAINKQLNIQYRNHRYRLHKYFQSFESRQEALRQVPEGVSEEDWKWLVSYFENDEFKKISERNKQNRAKNDCYTTVGTKSLARVVEKKKRKEDVELSEIDMFELSRKSKKSGGLVNDKAKETLDKMRELQATTSMTSKEICEQELGYVPGHIRGRSATKKQAAEVERWRHEIEDSRKRADEAEKRAAEVTQQFTAQQELIKTLQQQQTETRSLYDELTNQLKDLRK
ncbi:uncharacterized protein [Coffea arabica]|uniref:Uncharacterized protein isoform X1 n=1 Tax=Coffea arabica TaxID=13443 RepID=A0ABM4X3J3_COFAR